MTTTFDDFKTKVLQCLDSVKTETGGILRPNVPDAELERKGHFKRRDYYISIIAIMSIIVIAFIVFYILPYAYYTKTPMKVLKYQLGGTTKKGSDGVGIFDIGVSPSFSDMNIESPTTREIVSVGISLLALFGIILSLLSTSIDLFQQEGEYYETIIKSFDPNALYQKEECMKTKNNSLALQLGILALISMIFCVATGYAYIDQQESGSYLVVVFAYIIGIFLVSLAFLFGYWNIFIHNSTDFGYKCDQYFQ